MTVGFRAATGGQSSTAATSASVTKPAGAASGDMAIVSLITKDSQTFQAKVGWTLEQNANAATIPFTSATYRRTLDGTETWPIVFSWTGTSVKAAWTAGSWSPGTGGNVVLVDGEASVKVDTAGATTHTANAKTAVAASVASVIVNTHRNAASGSTGTTVTAATNWTEPTNGDQTTASGTTTALAQLGVEICYRLSQSGTVTPGSSTFSLSSSANVYHFLLTEVTPETSSALEASGYSSWSGINPGDTINSVTATVNQWQSTAAMGAPTYQLWDGANNAQIGTDNTGTVSTSTSNVDSPSWTGVTFVQLQTIRFRLFANQNGSVAGDTQSVDWIGLTVNYTPNGGGPSISETVVLNRRQIIPARFMMRARQGADLVPPAAVAPPPPATFVLGAPRYPQHSPAAFTRIPRARQTADFPVPSSPSKLDAIGPTRKAKKPGPYIWLGYLGRGVAESPPVPAPFIQAPAPTHSVRRESRPLWPRRGNVPPTGWPVPSQPPERMQSVRRGSRPLWPRRGVVPPTGLPVPVQPPELPRFVHRWTKPLLPRRGVVPPTGRPVPSQPPYNPRYVRRWIRPLLPRRGVVDTPLPIVKVIPPGSERARFRPPWPRRGVIPPSGLPVPVQPPERMQFVRRWSRPPWPRRGLTRNVAPPPVVVNPPISFSERREYKPPWPRRGTVPPSGLPVSVQPPERMQSVRRESRPLWPRRGVVRSVAPPPITVNPPIPFSKRRWLRPPLPRRGVVPPTGWPTKVQPPERMQAVRRWSQFIAPRKGNVRTVTPPQVVPPTPFVPSPSRARLRVPRRFGRTVGTQGIIPVPMPPVQHISRFRKIIEQRRVAPGVPTQPPPPQFPFNAEAARRKIRFRPRRRGQAVPGSGLPVPVQPPERMQSVRRWIRPLLPRKGVVPGRPFPFVAPPVPVVVYLPSWTWIYIVDPEAEISSPVPTGFIVITVPGAEITMLTPTVSIAVVIPLEQEEED